MARRPSSSNRRINTKAISQWLQNACGAAVLLTVIGGIGFGLYSLFAGEIRRENKADRMNDIREVINTVSVATGDDGLEYKLTGPSTIETGDRTNFLSINFRTQMISVDGSGDADRVLQFSEFESPDYLEDVREVGCQIANQIRVEFETGAEAIREYKEYTGMAEDITANSQSFLNHHCSGFNPEVG